MLALLGIPPGIPALAQDAGTRLAGRIPPAVGSAPEPDELLDDPPEELDDPPEELDDPPDPLLELEPPEELPAEYGASLIQREPSTFAKVTPPLETPIEKVLLRVPVRLESTIPTFLGSLVKKMNVEIMAHARHIKMHTFLNMTDTSVSRSGVKDSRV